MELVSLSTVASNIIVDLRYASINNVTGEQLYSNLEPQLAKVTAQKLRQASELFRQQSLRLVIWDAYRPAEAQEKLRQANPDSRYVAENSKHCLGLAVDATLADVDGRYLNMGTDFDEFTERAHIDAHDLTTAQRANRDMLHAVMQQVGFRPWQYEWWHFEDLQSYE